MNVLSSDIRMPADSAKRLKTHMGGVKSHDNNYCRTVCDGHIGGGIASNTHPQTHPHTTKQQSNTYTAKPKAPPARRVRMPTADTTGIVCPKFIQ